MTENTRPTATEITPEGEQVLVPGIAPITLRDRLVVRMAAPTTPKRNPDARQKAVRREKGPPDLSLIRLTIDLFDQAARDQCDLIDLLRAVERGASTPDHKQED